jgi:CheY-like chemotaxis protein
VTNKCGAKRIQSSYQKANGRAANVFKEDIEKCLSAGMDGHIGKPLDFEEVMQRLRDYWGKE